MSIDDDSLGARTAERQKQIDDLIAREARLVQNLQFLDEPSSVISAINALADQRKATEQELAELLHQQRHASEMAQPMRGLDVRLLQEWERLGALAYDERRAKLREFNVGVTSGSAITNSGLRLSGSSTSPVGISSIRKKSHGSSTRRRAPLLMPIHRHDPDRQHFRN
jgi:hypothetical protein